HHLFSFVLPDHYRIIPGRALLRYSRAAGCFRLASAACAEQNSAKGLRRNVYLPHENAQKPALFMRKIQ
ncbi:MAG: hypothetical protein NTX50_20950, partial [Candidatus Sumerlaeota bacterium]|nr:hypothetical protein [Candidatus Sumerlaeota bacterium]